MAKYALAYFLYQEMAVRFVILCEKIMKEESKEGHNCPQSTLSSIQHISRFPFKEKPPNSIQILSGPAHK